MASNTVKQDVTAKTDALHLNEREIDERFDKMISKWTDPLKDNLVKMIEEGNLPFGGQVNN